MASLGHSFAFFLMILITTIATLASGESAMVTFIFGDSLTEVGNNNHLQYSLAKSNYPYYGIDYEGGKATGRFTNGRTIGDIICTYEKNIFLHTRI